MSESNPGFGRKRKWANEPLVLFVEGYSDLTFYAELLEHLGLFSRCFIQDLGGKGRNKLRDEALLLLKPDNLARMKAVAVLLDADENADASFTLARHAIRDAVDFDVPQPGKWFEQTTTKSQFGIFIVAGANQKGEVETLAWEAWKSVAGNVGLRTCVEEFINCSRGRGLKLRSEDKVRIGAALSVLNEDDPRLGAGARAQLFDFNAVEFKPLCDFFSALKPFG